MNLFRFHHGALLVALSCAGCASSRQNATGNVDAAPTSDTGTDSAKEADTKPGACCPIGMPSCDCPYIGGSPPCRRGFCDVSRWRTLIDENGCEYLAPDPTAEVCNPPDPKTTGKACSIDDDCDTRGTGLMRCSKNLFSEGSLQPTPVCFGVNCGPPSEFEVKFCDANAGICVADGGDNLCSPRCTFDDSGAAPLGCIGKNTCSPFRSRLDLGTGKVIGDGLCFGGCRSDADCTGGDKCQIERALCVKSLVAYTKTIGDACSKTDAKACNCLYAPSVGDGYCTQRCRVGVDACPSGFTCDAQLPASIFTTSPAGILGWCLKDCTLDAECAALSATCLQSGGIGRKTCQPGLPM